MGSPEFSQPEEGMEDSHVHGFKRRAPKHLGKDEVDSLFEDIATHYDQTAPEGGRSPVIDDKKRPLPPEEEWGIPPSGYTNGNYDGDFPLESDL